jgi:hypothetical protein
MGNPGLGGHAKLTANQERGYNAPTYSAVGVNTKRYLFSVVITLLLASLLGTACSGAPSPSPKAITAPTSQPAPEPTPEPTPAAWRPKEYYNSIGYYLVDLSKDVEARLSGLPVKHSEAKSEFETTAEYKARQAEWQEEYEIAFEEYRSSIDMGDIGQKTILVVIPDVSAGTYDADNGRYTIGAKKYSRLTVDIVAPSGISFYYWKGSTRMAFSGRYPEYYDIRFTVEVPPEEAKAIREQEQRGNLVIVTTIRVDCTWSFKRNRSGDQVTGVSIQNVANTMLKATLNNKDGEVLYEW